MEVSYKHDSRCAERLSWAIPNFLKPLIHSPEHRRPDHAEFVEYVKLDSLMLLL